MKRTVNCDLCGRKIPHEDVEAYSSHLGVVPELLVDILDRTECADCSGMGTPFFFLYHELRE